MLIITQGYLEAGAITQGYGVVVSSGSPGAGGMPAVPYEHDYGSYSLPVAKPKDDKAKARKKKRQEEELLVLGVFD